MHGQGDPEKSRSFWFIPGLPISFRSLEKKIEVSLKWRINNEQITGYDARPREEVVLIALLLGFTLFESINKKDSRSIADIAAVARKIAIGASSDVAQAEWLLLRTENGPREDITRIDHFWSHYFGLVNEREDSNYQELTKLIKASLTLSPGSADVEYGFSRSGKIIGEDQALMSERVLDARLMVYDMLRLYGGKPERFVITKELLNLARSARYTVKLILLEFVNRYASVFYVAFFKGKFIGRQGKYNTIFGYRKEEWKRPSRKLTEMEYNRTNTDFEYSYTVKLILLEFVNRYASVFYVAFFKGKLIARPGKYNTIFGYRKEEWKRLSRKLTEMEYNRTNTDFEYSYTVKLILLEFVNRYASVFYVAFFKGKFIGRQGKYNTIFGYRKEEWKRLSRKLTEMEYNRTNTDFEYSYTVKLILLEFVNRYASVFYVAFFKGKFIGRQGKYNTIFGYRKEEWKRLSRKLTEMEYNRTNTDFEYSYTVKLILLEFVNRYASVFYVAFFKGKLIARPGKYNTIYGYRKEEWKRLSRKLTEMEYNRTNTDFEYSYTVKLILLEFVNRYASVFFVAFFKGKLIARPGKYNTIFGYRKEEWKRLSRKLTEMEYNRTNTDFEYSYTVKLILLEFVNRYASVFYVAFFKGKFIARPGKYNTIFGYRQEEWKRLSRKLTEMEYNRTNTDFKYSYTVKLILLEFVNRYASVFYVEFFKGKLIARPGKYNTIFGYRQEEWKRLSCKLTEMEYNRTNTDFEYSYTVKLILLEFVNRYASVFYVAFFKGKFIGRPGKYNTIFGYRQEECAPGGCMLELTKQLVKIMFGQKIINLLKFVIFYRIVPLIMKWWRPIETDVPNETDGNTTL
ncbi:hypothetical protein QYM36_002727 [Artemia franciscana]|uniref:Anoctamin n=1 Tax=Artemia franciscana TaxID=6661 RepID=A0AA88L8E6_ARTSF|nr:hypothetical protein QYM36_002727 [Artemia franciscana]